ncbi:hypothetical protein [Spirosoma utsteinense]|uniref:hypothetical protein n=1 Tax=Spirosoma utsteinense TaxID=2585773 RepID=UPI001645E459|nr:hypothetical protein [Spirosoma utsteinense]MBC3789103.1 hypothetical protein [Spirosoma utsteinense]
MSTEESLLHRCKTLIEVKLGRGDNEQWKHKDFSQLSEAIFSVTGVSLSINTLKRLWGRIHYESVPTRTTLDALALYLGYSGWQSFRLAPTEPEVPLNTLDTVAPLIERSIHSPIGPTRRLFGRFSAGLAWSIGLSTSLSLALLLSFSWRPASSTNRKLDPTKFTFSSQRVTTGLPNSVVFQYDASAAPTDSVFIQQSWDPRRRKLVARTGHQHTSIYYHPGYFRAKLIVGQQIVQEHDLLIPSEGWHIALLQEPVPVYFKAANFIKSGVMHVPVRAITQHNITMQPHPPLVRYRFIKEFDGLRSDNFILETRLKQDYREGSSACQNTLIMIHTKTKMFFIPLSAKGCTANLNLVLAGHEVRGDETDLGALGANLNQWVDVRCEVLSKRVRILINNTLAYQAVLPIASAELVGITYEFEGTGSVDYCRFKRPTNEIVFEDTF